MSLRSAVVVTLVIVSVAGEVRADEPDLDAALAAMAADEEAKAEVVEINGKVPETAQPTTYELTADEVRSMPGAANDALRALQALPGVARIPFSFGGLVLRGTSPRDTRVFLDGIEVPIAFHFGGVTSFYPSSLLDHIELVGGNYGVEHGRGIGGLVDLRTRAPRGDRWREGAELSMLDSSVRAEGPAGGGALLLGVRRSYVDALVAALYPADNRFLPRYYDAQLQWVRGDVTVMLFASDDHGSFQAIELASRFARAGVRWARQLGPTRLEVTPWIGVDHLGASGSTTGPDPLAVASDRTIVPGGLRASIVRDEAWGSASAGLDLRGRRDRVTTGTAPTETRDRLTVDTGVWAELMWRRDRLVARPGVRVDRFGADGEATIDPRLNTSVRFADRAILRQAIGLYHQPPTPDATDPDGGNPALRASSAIEATLGLDLDLPAAIQASVTGYYVDQRGIDLAPKPTFEQTLFDEGSVGPILFELIDAQLEGSGYRENLGRGRGYGVEVSVKRHAGPLFAWLAYTYGRAQRTDPTRVRGWFPYLLDQPHNVNAVVALDVGGWRFGARLQASSGIPYTPVVAEDPFTAKPTAYGPPMSARVPAFVAIDLRVDHTWRRRWGAIDLFLDLQNAADRDNVEAIAAAHVGHVDYTYGLPLLPIVGVSYTPAD